MVVFHVSHLRCVKLRRVRIYFIIHFGYISCIVSFPPLTIYLIVWTLLYLNFLPALRACVYFSLFLLLHYFPPSTFPHSLPFPLFPFLYCLPPSFFPWVKAKHLGPQCVRYDVRLPVTASQTLTPHRLPLPFPSRTAGRTSPLASLPL